MLVRHRPYTCAVLASIIKTNRKRLFLKDKIFSLAAMCFQNHWVRHHFF